MVPRVFNTAPAIVVMQGVSVGTVVCLCSVAALGAFAAGVVFGPKVVKLVRDRIGKNTDDAGPKTDGN